MNTAANIDPRKVCEALLAEEIACNSEAGICFSETRVARVLLRRGIEMSGPYRELHEKLGGDQWALKEFLKVVLSTAAHWNPEKLEASREAKRALTELNEQIRESATFLADLLKRRTSLSNTSPFYSDSHHSVCVVIEGAGASNPEFQLYLKRDLETLCDEHKLTHWPSVAEFIEELARDAGRSRVMAGDRLTNTGTRSERTSKSDAVRVFFESLQPHPAWPTTFRLTHAAMASVVSCALDLDAEDMITADSVKSVQARTRRELE